jgi:hypothetical protein
MGASSERSPGNGSSNAAAGDGVFFSDRRLGKAGIVGVPVMVAGFADDVAGGEATVVAISTEGVTGVGNAAVTAAGLRISMREVVGDNEAAFEGSTAVVALPEFVEPSERKRAVPPPVAFGDVLLFAGPGLPPTGLVCVTTLSVEPGSEVVLGCAA